MDLNSASIWVISDDEVVENRPGTRCSRGGLSVLTGLICAFQDRIARAEISLRPPHLDDTIIHLSSSALHISSSVVEQRHASQHPPNLAIMSALVSGYASSSDGEADTNDHSIPAPAGFDYDASAAIPIPADDDDDDEEEDEGAAKKDLYGLSGGAGASGSKDGGFKEKRVKVSAAPDVLAEVSFDSSRIGPGRDLIWL